EARCTSNNEDPDVVLASFLGSDSESESFWQRAKTNLQAGKIRLLFVADLIPPELRRIVEFLNQQMDPAEVLGLEVKQYVGEGQRTLVPRVIGQTAEAEQKKSAGGSEARHWDESSFFRELEARRPLEESRAARKLLDWAKVSMPDIWWGKGRKDGSFFPGLTLKGATRTVFAVYTYGNVEMQFQYMRAVPPFDDRTKRLEFLRRLNGISGVKIPEDAIERRPSIPLSVLTNDTALKEFISALDWYV